MDPRKIEIFRALRESQTKYTYYLLTAAAAGIALSIKITFGIALSSSQLFLGVAVLFWAFSFYCGCKGVSYASSTLYANLAQLSVLDGTHPDLTDASLPEKQAAVEGIGSAMQKNSEKVGDYVYWQFIFLIMGGVAFVIWHVYEMSVLAGIELW